MPGVVPYGLIGVDWEERIDFARMRGERLEKARAAMKKFDLDVLFLFRYENTRYISGLRTYYHPTTDVGPGTSILTRDRGPIVFYGDADHVLTRMPWIRPEDVNSGVSLEELIGVQRFAEVAKKYLGSSYKGRIGVDLWSPALYHNLPKEFPAATMLDGQEAIMDARMIKTKDEIACMEVAYAMSEAGMQASIDFLKPGVRECEVLGEALRKFWELGSEWTQCGQVICSGPNTAPYRRFSSDRIIQDGDIVVLDWGACFNGYFGDFARGWLCGRSKPTEEQKKVWRNAYEQLNAIQNAIKPGITNLDVWRKVEGVFASQNARPQSPPAHAIGIGGSEPPSIRPNTDPVTLKPGMVFSVIGHYVKNGVGGVKIENNVVVTDTGCLVYSTYPYGPLSED